ncbi:MAG: acylneuraminate cytidylyltransferase family protein [Elusimicrobiota bacterium]
MRRIAAGRPPIILGVTPARGGSKGIPRKNIRPIAGKPLLAWTIEQANASKLLTRYVVSTEDAEIAGVARGYGADVLKRPARLAGDAADTLPVLRHALDEIPADIVVLLQCTSPVRAGGLIDRCIERFLSAKKRTAYLGTVFQDRAFELGRKMPRRQEIRPKNLDIGNVYVVSADLIRKSRSFGAFAVKPIPLPISREEAVEIDEPFDFWLAEKILLERRPD